MIAFANPKWLWAIACLPLLGVALWRLEKARRERFALFADPVLWSRIAPELDFRAGWRKTLTFLLAGLFAILALARPQWGVREEMVKVSGLDIVVALDLSNSMDVEDVVPSRIQKAKHLVRSISERLWGDRLGLVGFAGSAYLATPLTTDVEYFLESLDILDTRMISNQGTDIGNGLETAARALERAAENAAAGGDPQATEAGQATRLILLVSDGEDHEEKALEIARGLPDREIRLFAFGIGTERGGPVPQRDETGKLQGYRKKKGEPVISAFHPAALQEIAGAAKGRYWDVTSREEEIEQFLKEAGAFSRNELSERRVVTREDRYQLPLAIALLLLLLELSLPARKIEAASGVWRWFKYRSQYRSGKAATAVILGLSGHLTVALLCARADAAPLGAYLDNRKGVEAFEAGNFEEAKKRFDEAQRRAPDRGDIQYNRGTVELAANPGAAPPDEASGETHGEAPSEGMRWLGEAAKDALGRGDFALAGKSLYNLGGALSKKGDAKGAVTSYLGAIESARRSGDEALETDARKNLELIVRQQQEKKQQQKNQQGKSGGQDEKDKKQPSQGEKPDDQQKDQAKQYEDSSRKGKQRYRSEKLSKEDAERVLAELANRERELQGSLRKQKGQPKPKEKDW